MRIETIEKTIYTFDELSDDAKEKAREWWRDCERQDSNYHECVVDDFVTICDLVGVDIRSKPVRLMGGGTRMDPCVYWSGFWSQGDGASFEGSYSYEKGACRAVRAHAPSETKIHAIADRLQAVQRKYFYQLGASVSQSGRYYHSHTMSVDVEDTRDRWRDVVEDDAEEIKECMRDLADWFYHRLEEAYEWTMADEQVDESIRANEYEFDEDGRIA